jgi:hypothetical protein
MITFTDWTHCDSQPLPLTWTLEGMANYGIIEAIEALRQSCKERYDRLGELAAIEADTTFRSISQRMGFGGGWVDSSLTDLVPPLNHATPVRQNNIAAIDSITRAMIPLFLNNSTPLTGGLAAMPYWTEETMLAAIGQAAFVSVPSVNSGISAAWVVQTYNILRRLLVAPCFVVSYHDSLERFYPQGQFELYAYCGATRGIIFDFDEVGSGISYVSASRAVMAGDFAASLAWFEGSASKFSNTLQRLFAGYSWYDPDYTWYGPMWGLSAEIGTLSTVNVRAHYLSNIRGTLPAISGAARNVTILSAAEDIYYGRPQYATWFSSVFKPVSVYLENGKYYPLGSDQALAAGAAGLSEYAFPDSFATWKGWVADAFPLLAPADPQYQYAALGLRHTGMISVNDFNVPGGFIFQES